MPSITRRRTAKVGRPTSAEADVLDATQRLLAGGANFTELGVQQICTEAGVARSTFYSHFRDKVDLLLRLAGRLMASSFDLTSAWQPSAGVEGLEEAFVHVIEVYRRHAAVRRALAEVATYDTAVRDYFTAELHQFTDWTIKILRDEQEAGRTPPTSTPSAPPGSSSPAANAPSPTRSPPETPPATPRSPANWHAPGGTASTAAPSARSVSQ